MDFHLNSLLDLSQATVFTCYHEHEDLNELERAELQVLFQNSVGLELAYCFKEELRQIYENNLTVKAGFRKMKKW
jgi:Transposase